MKHLFVPYEIALLAKDKGFDKPCLAYYERQQLSNIVEYSNSKLRQENLINEQSLAPIYQQLIDWFREKHDIHIVPQPILTRKYSFVVDRAFKPKIETEELDYYEALNKALEEAFKLI